MVSYQRLNPSMALLTEAQAALNRRAQPSLLTFDLVKNILALALRYQGQIEAAIAVNQSVEEVYQRHHIRFSRALNLYNMGLAIYDQEENTGGHLSQKYFTDALELASEVDGKEYMGMCLYGLSLIQLREKNLDEARSLAEKSLALFVEVEAEDWDPRRASTVGRD